MMASLGGLRRLVRKAADIDVHVDWEYLKDPQSAADGEGNHDGQALVVLRLLVVQSRGFGLGFCAFLVTHSFLNRNLSDFGLGRDLNREAYDKTRDRILRQEENATLGLQTTSRSARSKVRRYGDTTRSPPLSCCVPRNSLEGVKMEDRHFGNESGAGSLTGDEKGGIQKASHACISLFAR